MVPKQERGFVMDTIKIKKGNTQMVAHRGVSGLELENTNAAFIAAGNRSYFGVETDVHVTADGKFIIFHDDNTKRVGTQEMIVEETDFAALRDMPLKRKDGTTRCDLRMPSLEEYLDICKHYEKVCVLELKNPMTKDAVWAIVEECRRVYDLEHLIFISFCFENMVYVKTAAPEANTQFLIGEPLREEQLEAMIKHGIHLDAYYKLLTPELIQRLHGLGIVVNCWTVDDPAKAEELIAWGVDQITSNILE